MMEHHPNLNYANFQNFRSEIVAAVASNVDPPVPHFRNSVKNKSYNFKKLRKFTVVGHYSNLNYANFQDDSIEIVGAVRQNVNVLPSSERVRKSFLKKL